MVFAYSPHRDGGGTLHVLSPSSTQTSESNSALAQLRQSLSRSPSRGPAFRLITSKSNSPSPSSPLSPSPLSPSRRTAIFAADSPTKIHEPAPLGSPFLTASKKKRPIVRHLSPMRPSSRSLGSQRSPAKRVLADCSDHGNATPSSSASSSEGAENESQSGYQSGLSKRDIPILAGVPLAQEKGTHLTPHHAIARRERPNGYFDIAKSSPLKRSEGSTNLDLAHLGTPAKRRSLHGASFGSDFNIFDHAAAFEQTNTSTQVNEATPGLGRDAHSPFTPLPHRSASLRKTTLQQRFEKPAVERVPFGTDNVQEFRALATPDVKSRSRLSLEFPVPQMPRDSPFTSDNLLSASIHHAPLMRREASGSGQLHISSRHPLARTISQSSSNSGVALDSPTHVPARHPEHFQARRDFSRSLPLGASRPREENTATTATSSQESYFSTPNNYQLAKPLPAAFMSTGLISKRNKNIDPESAELDDSLGNMPDTPCKRPTSLNAMAAEPTPDINLHKTRQARHTMHSFGTPSTPYNPHMSRAPLQGTTGLTIFGSGYNNADASRRGSFAAADIDEGLKSPLATFRQNHGKGFRTSPSPTKQASDSSLSCAANFPFFEDVHKDRPISKADSVMDSPKSAFNCKSISVSKPGATKEDKSCGYDETSPSSTMRFRSLNSVPYFSKRPQAAGRFHCPTPLSKASLSLPIFPKQSKNAKSNSLTAASPILDRQGGRSPHTPLEAMLPPDPSGLSISAHADKTNANRYETANLNSSFGVPATPTAPRDSFGRTSKFHSSVTPVHQAFPAEIDTSLTSRFDKVEPLSSGEFSQVFRVARKSEPAAPRKSFGASQVKRPSGAPLSEQIWAVKKANRAYIGPRDRVRRLQEVDVLRALGPADHTVNYVDSWEFNSLLYIQTEFCEEGALDLFLERAGQSARLDDFRIWKIMLELSLGLKHIHDSGFIHLDLKPANILITFEGVLKIADFGMATSWPAQVGIEGEGDRGYIGPEILKGKFDKPADIFAFGLIMLEIAGNVRLPENGASWQRLRSGDMSDVPSLTSSSEVSSISRDESGNPILSQTIEDFRQHNSGFAAFDFGFETKPPHLDVMQSHIQRAGELHVPPEFMVNPGHESALDRVVRWMISPEAAHRPTADNILATEGVRWTEARRRAGATIFEGNYGPADDILHHDAEMIDV